MGYFNIEGIDYKKKENQTFWKWFQFCIVNWWLPITLVGFILLVLELANIGTISQWLGESYAESVWTGIFVTPFLFMPLAIFGITAYKGCYKHWKFVCTGDQKYNE
jgi:hypothetical protein